MFPPVSRKLDRAIVIPTALCALAAWFSLAAARIWANPGVPRLFFQTWQTDDGLPQNHGTAFAQTRDGYLWIGTYNGLVRFDGMRFQVFNTANTPGMSSSRVTSLHEDRSGALWAGHDGGELTRMQHGQFESVVLATNWPRRTIVAMAQDEAGDFWLLDERGLAFRLQDSKTIPPAEGSASPSLVRQESGTLWRVHGGKMRIVGIPARTVAPPSAPPEDDFIVRACAARDGGFWLACGERVRRWDNRGGVTNWGRVPWGSDSVTAMVESRDGLLWVGTLAKGLFILSQEGSFANFTRTNGLPHDWVRGLTQDREGTVWIGTGGGVCAARERAVAMVDAPDHWRGSSTLSLSTGADGSKWIGTEGAGVYRLRNGEWTRWGEREGLTNLFVWSVLEDPRGQVWAGTWGGGLFQLSNDRFVPAPGLAGDTIPICALFAARDGALWAGTQKGLLRLKDGRTERIAENLSRPEVRTIAEAKDGAIWFGMSGGGLGCWREGRVQQFRQTDGLPSDYVWSLLMEPDDTLWIGTFGGGLGRLRDGKFSTVGPNQGLPNNVISHLADDGSGRLWMGSYGGILRASKEELNRCFDGRVKSVPFFSYGKSEGMAALECAEGLQPGIARTADGHLWFPTSKGLAVVDPASARTNLLAPPVLIEELLVDGIAESMRDAAPPRTRGVSSPSHIRIPPGRQRFEFRFTAPSFVAPERVRFKYRLEGLENDWQDAGSKRLVNYSFLSPGHYTFHVIACNNDGVWNKTGASLSLTVLPYFWQTLWFRLGAALAAAAAVGGAVRMVVRRRYRHRLEQLERQRAIEKERARIAKDIHDDLGASLTRITLLSQTARGDLDEPERAAADIDRIYDTARDLTRAMDEIVWAVNPQHDTLDSLVSYLGGFAQDFLSAADVRCRLDVPFQLPLQPLTAEVRHNLFLAFKEAVHNVLRHAGATEARVIFQLEPSGFVLAVHDNGRGFDSTEPLRRKNGTLTSGPRRASGNGLSNMRRRLEEIGGQCTVESAVGRGTQVRFAVRLSSSTERPRAMS